MATRAAFYLKPENKLHRLVIPEKAFWIFFTNCSLKIDQKRYLKGPKKCPVWSENDAFGDSNICSFSGIYWETFTETICFFVDPVHVIYNGSVYLVSILSKYYNWLQRFRSKYLLKPEIKSLWRDLRKNSKNGKQLNPHVEVGKFSYQT